jgi:transcriptional regulator with XRE-family HTH domain
MSNILHSQYKEGSGARPDVLAHVGINVRLLRQSQKLSQSALAGLSGISRRMIVAVEGGEANISLSTLDRVATALKVSFSELVRPPEASDNRRIDSIAWRGNHAESRGVLLGTSPAAREAELWIWSLGEGESYPAEADSARWHEMLFVIEGVLQVETEESARNIVAGDFLIFNSDRPYTFINTGTGTVRFVRNVVY